jgi:hypothetical protein
MSYGREGVVTWTVDGRGVAVGPGDRCFIPRGAVHRFVNAGNVPSRTLSVLTPGTIGPAFFREAAALLSAGAPPDPARMAEVMRRHGLIVVPPGSG